MNGDYLANGQQRTVNVPDTVGDSVPDSDDLAGTPLETDTYTQAGGTIAAKTVTGPFTVTTTQSNPRNAWTSQSPAPTTLSTLPALNAYRPVSTTSRSYGLLASGSWRETKTVTGFDAQGRTSTVDNLGDVSVPAQEKCTTTTYATPSTNPMMLDFPDEIITVAGPCSTVPSSTSTATASGGCGLGVCSGSCGRGPGFVVGSVTSADGVRLHGGGLQRRCAPSAGGSPGRSAV